MKHSSMILLLLTILLFTSVSQAVDPPVKMWEKWYYTSYDVCYFRDIEIAPSGNLLITCLAYDYTDSSISKNYVALLVDQSGNVIWEVPHEYDGASGYDGIAFQDGSFIITGSATDYSSSSIGLYIHKIASDGTTEWTKLYDYPDTKEAGYGITCLPDGGFAVCGRVHGTGIQHGKAWILRTDANGDTLWTETWGTVNTNWGKSILYANDMLCILANGADSTQTTYGTHLLFYDLDGEYLGGSDYSNLYLYKPGDFCPASDGGFTFVTKTLPVIWHTDQFGETLWWHNIPTQPNYTHEGYCIRQTMDSGYIFSGWTGWWQWWPDEDFNAPVAEVDTGCTQDAWLVRYDSEGNVLWNLSNETGNDNHFYSVVQLPQGGYIAGGTYAGSGGYLVRYAPETGIESEEPSPAIVLGVSPNPFSSSVNISFDIPEAAPVELSVYDLSGRMVERLISGSAASGEHLSVWNPGVSVSAGCYMARLSTSCGSTSVMCVYLK